MDGDVLDCAAQIKNICKTLKALPSNDSAFSVYKRSLFAKLQRLVLRIGLDVREDFKEEEHPRAENGQFAKKAGGATRKGKMKPEIPVTFKNPKVLNKDKAGGVISHFNHDEDIMDVTKGFPLMDECADSYNLCVGKIEHLTVYAGKGTDVKLGVADSIARQHGGKPEDWKHVKGMGKVKGKDGNIEEADIHWFENENIGQVRWKIKQKRSEMGESSIYWKSK